jgi:basic membrane protein A
VTTQVADDDDRGRVIAGVSAAAPCYISESDTDHDQGGEKYMNRHPWLKSVLALTTVAALIAGCGAPQSGTSTSGGATGSTSKSPIKVGLITDTGGLNDHSFNHLAYVGLQKAEQQLGVKGTVIQSNSEADYVPNLSKLARQGYDLVIAVGYLMTDAVKQVAKQYPHTKFLIIDVPVDHQPNLAGAVFKTEQSAYLAGAMAGLLEQTAGIPKMNKDNVIGVVGGMKIPPVEEYIAGYQQGFKKTDPHGKLLVKWTNTFNDQALGSQIAQSEIQSGADIVFQLAGGAGIGVIQAAKNAGVYAIGADADQSYLAKGTVLTSTLKGVDTATFEIVKDVVDHKFKSGTHYFDLADHGVGLAKFDKVVPKSVIDQVNQLAEQIRSGKVQVSPKMQ